MVIDFHNCAYEGRGDNLVPSQSHQCSGGRDGYKKGVCTMNVTSEDMTVEFPFPNIQWVRKKDIAEDLKLRQDIRENPFS